MIITKTGDYIGYSESGIDDAIANALSKAGDCKRVEVIETRGSQIGEDQRQYQVTLAAFME